MVMAKRTWRKYIVPRVVARQLHQNNYASAEISGIHAWSLRVPGEESLKISKLCRRAERLLDNTLRLTPTPQRDQKNKLIRVSFQQA